MGRGKTENIWYYSLIPFISLTLNGLFLGDLTLGLLTGLVAGVITGFAVWVYYEQRNVIQANKRTTRRLGSKKKVGGTSKSGSQRSAGSMPKSPTPATSSSGSQPAKRPIASGSAPSQPPVTSRSTAHQPPPATSSTFIPLPFPDSFSRRVCEAIVDYHISPQAVTQRTLANMLCDYLRFAPDEWGYLYILRAMLADGSLSAVLALGPQSAAGRKVIDDFIERGGFDRRKVMSVIAGVYNGFRGATEEKRT